MKKTLLFILIVLLGNQSLYSRNVTDTSEVEKTGWLVYYLDHVIWVESDITNKVKDKSFFSPGKYYKNGLIVDHISDAKSFKSIAKCYSVKILLQTDSITKKADYLSKERICIIPVKVKIITHLKTEPLDLTGISFKRKKRELTMEYWFLTNYSISKIQLLRHADSGKLKSNH